MKKLQLLFFGFSLHLFHIQASNPDSEKVQGNAEALPTPEAQISSDAELVAGVINDFAFKLLRTDPSNFNSAISPISIFLALAMTYLGSGGRTKEQLEDVLGLDSHDLHGLRLHEDLSKLMSKLPPKSNDFKLKAANAMVVDQNFELKPKFLEDLRYFYSILLEKTDFRNGNSVVNTVNHWVAQQTENAITKILERPPGPEPGMILLNAVYFRGTWETQFPPNSTANKPFTLSDGTSISVPFMAMPKIRLKYFQDLGLKYSFVRLPYKGDHISMILALPDELGVADIKMSHDLLCRIRSTMRPFEIELVSIPKFRIEFSRKLNDPLISLGAPDMFNPSVANFSGMREEKGLFVSSINHKVLLEVDEKGSVAAAVTTVSLVRLSLARKLRFVADKPFTFYIVDERSGLILFMGKVASPSVGNTANPLTRGSIKPSRGDTIRPSAGDTIRPSAGDTIRPSAGDTIRPSAGDTIRPSAGDTIRPSAEDTIRPSTGDTIRPSAGDTMRPSAGDTIRPSTGDTIRPPPGDTIRPPPGDTIRSPPEDTIRPSTRNSVDASSQRNFVPAVKPRRRSAQVTSTPRRRDRYAAPYYTITRVIFQVPF